MLSIVAVPTDSRAVGQTAAIAIDGTVALGALARTGDLFDPWIDFDGSPVRRIGAAFVFRCLRPAA